MDTPTPPLHSASGAGHLPPIPKPFHMSELFYERGLWCFWLTADEGVLQYVTHLPCVLSATFPGGSLLRRRGARMLVEINPRYHREEAWAWISDVLEGETRLVELEAGWETAIETAFESTDEG
jgi:hypothetical protein